MLNMQLSHLKFLESFCDFYIKGFYPSVITLKDGPHAIS